jgi:hypothetical protein
MHTGPHTSSLWLLTASVPFITTFLIPKSVAYRALYLYTFAPAPAASLLPFYQHL